MSQDKEQALPFFARFLERQFCEDLSHEEMDAVQGGRRFAKRRLHDIPDDGIVVTLKYPSDNEEGDHPIIKYTSYGNEHAVTNKYPSDGDDDGSFIS